MLLLGFRVRLRGRRSRGRRGRRRQPFMTERLSHLYEIRGPFPWRSGRGGLWSTFTGDRYGRSNVGLAFLLLLLLLGFWSFGLSHRPLRPGRLADAGIHRTRDSGDLRIPARGTRKDVVSFGYAGRANVFAALEALRYRFCARMPFAIHFAHSILPGTRRTVRSFWKGSVHYNVTLPGFNAQCPVCREAPQCNACLILSHASSID